MQDRATIVRNYILDQIENGELVRGEKLLGAREIASSMKFSLITVQNAIDGLVNEGVLLTVPRQGTFVHELWDSRVIQRNITPFINSLPWLDELCDIVSKRLPLLRVCSGFKESVFEIRTTQYVQAHQDEYLDLSSLYEECTEDKSDIITTPFKSFFIGKKLVGVPIAYSPRVIFYNTELFKKAGCDEPYSGWSWDEFVTCVKKLKEVVDPGNVINWHCNSYLWMNFVVRAGGSLFDFSRNDPVTIDSLETRKGLSLFRQLGDIIGVKGRYIDGNKFNKSFMDGEIAMNIDAREFLAHIKKSDFKNWNVVALPRIPGGKDLNVQATDLFCVKKSCVNLDNAKELIKIFHSQEFQDHLAVLRYALPIRKSSTTKSIDYTNQSDMLFLTESTKMYSSYNLDSVELYNLVCETVGNILSGDDDIDACTEELADMVRSYINIKTKIRKIA